MSPVINAFLGVLCLVLSVLLITTRSYKMAAFNAVVGAFNVILWIAS